MSYSASQFEENYRRQYPSLKGTLTRLLRNPHQAEDLTQDAFLQAWKKRSHYRENGNLAGWICRIGINLSINHLRRSKFEFAVDPSRLEEILGSSSEFRDDSYQRAAAWEESSLLQLAFRQLSPKFSQVVSLCDLQGYTYREAARVLNIPQGTVMSRLYRARRKLKKELAPFFQ